MAKRQTRRSISVMGKTYARISNYCRQSGESISGVLERLIAAEMERAGIPEVATAPAHTTRSRKGDFDGKVASGIFTF